MQINVFEKKNLMLISCLYNTAIRLTFLRINMKLFEKIMFRQNTDIIFSTRIFSDTLNLISDNFY